MAYLGLVDYVHCRNDGPGNVRLRRPHISKGYGPTLKVGGLVGYQPLASTLSVDFPISVVDS